MTVQTVPLAVRGFPRNTSKLLAWRSRIGRKLQDALRWVELEIRGIADVVAFTDRGQSRRDRLGAGLRLSKGHQQCVESRGVDRRLLFAHLQELSLGDDLPGQHWTLVNALLIVNRRDEQVQILWTEPDHGLVRQPLVIGQHPSLVLGLIVEHVDRFADHLLDLHRQQVLEPAQRFDRRSIHILYVEVKIGVHHI